LRPGGRFVTEFGPATESPASPHYGPDSYWRGPIWPSQTVLLVDGLKRSGFAREAGDLAERFCRMCAATNTFAENHNATTGQPLCDKAYTWGSSGFLFLASNYLPRKG
jgi:glycogen debranching enzyme